MLSRTDGGDDDDFWVQLQECRMGKGLVDDDGRQDPQ